MSTYSRSHDTGTFMSTATPRCEKKPGGQVRGPPRGGEPAEGPRPGGPRREQRVSDLSARVAATSKLLEVAEIVLIEEPDVGCASTKHREALDAAAKGKALVSRWVIAHASQHVRMDHA